MMLLDVSPKVFVIYLEESLLGVPIASGLADEVTAGELSCGSHRPETPRFSLFGMRTIKGCKGRWASTNDVDISRPSVM